MSVYHSNLYDQRGVFLVIHGRPDRGKCTLPLSLIVIHGRPDRGKWTILSKSD